MNQAVDEVKALVVQWLDAVVIGLNLCPFAKGSRDHGLIGIQVSAAETPDALAAEIEECLLRLEVTPASELETVLVVLPQLLPDFEQYNAFLDVTDALLESRDWEGVFQIASFHPQYQFAETEPDDISNWTNRAPYPIFHLLREESIERAVASLADPEEIYQSNRRKMAELSEEQREQLFSWLHESKRSRR